ncbi:Type II secretion system protein F [Poriferisphaera corsica]|uniref:General secretion pathway protein F n=1 Tax=Poriferisphaera corsica TaxID=2528020 RepID=A0A517YWH3_9BACT|nr:type II secretion system F family protein [Poriferisphaera corsica]QDU34578.1 Type II secretion system protein F [Poriferisphaera corsica]
MAVFGYIASDGGAKLLEGSVVADSVRAARDQLRERGLRVHEITSNSGSTNGRFVWLRMKRGVRSMQMVEFVRELSTLLGVGTPLLEALDTVIKQQRGAVHLMLLQIRERVASGISLSEALREAKDCGNRGIDSITISMVAVGEDAGNLDEVLDELANFKEHSAALKNRVLSALLYPMIVFSIGILVSVFLMTYVVPGLIEALDEAGQELPAVTQVVKAVSDFLVYKWWLILGVLAVIVAAVMALMRMPRGRYWVHQMVLRIPILGDLICKQAVVQLSFVIATLMRSGIHFEQAISLARSSMRNMLLRDALEETEAAVREGCDIAEALEKTGVFGATVVQVFALGQQSGKMEQMLTRLGRDYDRQVATAAARFTTVLEPVMIVLLAVMIGMIAFATILPIMEMGNTL